MNRPYLPNSTDAAEGLRRRRFTVVEIEKMVEAGILLEDERVELIGGELVPMSPKGNRHELLKVALMRTWARQCPDDLAFAPETTFRLSDDTYLEPDFVFFPRRGLTKLSSSTALLAVEISDSSLGFDLGRKADVYAAFGVPELWVIDAVHLITRIHLEASPTGYRKAVDCSADQRLVPERAPGLAIVLAEIDLES